ncbi:lasso peptide biosynthesis B2 protein [Nocardiopsis sp. NPDC049922]|uniref:lasso peptide biosynthesis B2 protein n=1 Tax=Nocardiopsis sp. NPDC049922 TaxID=3155157 RepID=UPI003410548E
MPARGRIDRPARITRPVSRLPPCLGGWNTGGIVLVGVCDFPGRYAFPPAGYGGIERWLWAVAVGARAAGADVHLLGPGWLPGRATCPENSLAATITTLLIRRRVDWCIGARLMPYAAHAWIEVSDEPAGEPREPDHPYLLLQRT